MTANLTTSRRAQLRAAAHILKPVVLVGDKGLTDEVVAEIERALKAHELIKIRAATADRVAREAWIATICERLGAHPVQVIGKVLVVWRENPPAKKPPPRKAAVRPSKSIVPKEAYHASPRGKGRSLARKKPRTVSAAAFGAKARSASGAGSGAATGVKRISRPRSQAPSPPPASGPRRRPRNTSR